MVVLTRSAYKRQQQKEKKEEKKGSRKHNTKYKKRSIDKRKRKRSVHKRSRSPLKINLNLLTILNDIFDDDPSPPVITPSPLSSAPAVVTSYISSAISAVTSIFSSTAPTPTLTPAPAPAPALAPTPAPTPAPARFASPSGTEPGSVTTSLSSTDDDGAPNEESTASTLKRIKNCCDILNINSTINNIEILNQVNEFFKKNNYIPKYEYSDDDKLQNLNKVNNTEKPLLLLIDIRYQYESLFDDIQKFYTSKMSSIVADTRDDIDIINSILPPTAYAPIKQSIIDAYINTKAKFTNKVLFAIEKFLGKTNNSLLTGTPDATITNFTLHPKCIITSINNTMAYQLKNSFEKLLDILQFEKSKTKDHNFVYYRMYFEALKKLYGVLTKRPNTYDSIETDEYFSKLGKLVVIYNQIIIMEDYNDILDKSLFTDMIMKNTGPVLISNEVIELKNSIKSLIDNGFIIQLDSIDSATKQNGRIACINYDLTPKESAINYTRKQVQMISEVFPYKPKMKQIILNLNHINAFYKTTNVTNSGIETLLNRDTEILAVMQKKLSNKFNYKGVYPDMKYSGFLPIYIECKTFVDNFVTSFDQNYNMTNTIKEINIKINKINNSILIGQIDLVQPVIIPENTKIILATPSWDGLLEETLPIEVTNNNIKSLTKLLSTYLEKYSYFIVSPLLLKAKFNRYTYYSTDSVFNLYVVKLLDEVLTYRIIPIKRDEEVLLVPTSSSSGATNGETESSEETVIIPTLRSENAVRENSLQQELLPTSVLNRSRRIATRRRRNPPVIRSITSSTPE